MQDVGVVFEPIIDAQNPPIAVDSVILAESGTGSVRVSCFSGNAYVEREDIVQSQNGGTLNRKWIRPVAIIDAGSGVVHYLEGYLLYRLSNNSEELKRVLSQNPQLVAGLKALLGEM